MVDYLLKHPDRLNPGGEFFEGSVLFLDIQDFTGLASRLPARELVALLSQTLGRFADMVLSNGGMMDKIAGDGLMAVWGVPVPFLGSCGRNHGQSNGTNLSKASLSRLLSQIFVADLRTGLNLCSHGMQLAISK